MYRLPATSTVLASTSVPRPSMYCTKQAQRGHRLAQQAHGVGTHKHAPPLDVLHNKTNAVQPQVGEAGTPV